MSIGEWFQRMKDIIYIDVFVGSVLDVESVVVNLYAGFGGGGVAR